MTPQDHWNNILLSNPHYRPTNRNGWDFSPVVSKPRNIALAAWAVAGVAVALVSIIVFIQQG